MSSFSIFIVYDVNSAKYGSMNTYTQLFPLNCKNIARRYHDMTFDPNRTLQTNGTPEQVNLTTETICKVTTLIYLLRSS